MSANPSVRLLATAAIALALAACGMGPTGGGLLLQARFPDPLVHAPGSRTLAIIPDGTVKIVVRVTGDGIPVGSVMAATLTPDRASTAFTGVPAGPKIITARCYDGADGILASGETSLTIVAGRTVKTSLRMELTSDEGGFQLILQ